MANYPIITPLLPPAEEPLEVSDFVDLMTRLMDSGWLLPLRQPGPGGEILDGGYAALFARLSQAAVNQLGAGGFILSSSGGVLATGFVAVTRPTNTAGAVTIRAGTILTASVNGANFVTTADAFLDAADDVGTHSSTVAYTDPTHKNASSSVGVIAVAFGYEWNLPGQANAANGDSLAGSIDTVTLLFETPPFGDDTVDVSQIFPTTGGQDAILDEHANDRGLERKPGEPDDALALRIRQLPDTVSPAAILRVANDALSVFGIYALEEEPLGPGSLPAATGYGPMTAGFFDVDPSPVGGVVSPLAVGLYYFDQGLGPGLNVVPPVGGTASLGTIGPQNESLDTFRAFFRLAMPYVPNVNPGLGFSFFDAFPYPPAGFFDTLASFGDGTATPTAVAAGAAWDAVNQIKAGGVGFEVVIDPRL